MKIYTGTGDKGNTSLLEGVRVSKASKEIELIGHIDELSSVLGLAIFYASSYGDRNLLKLLAQIQMDLFELGAFTASKTKKAKYFTKKRITKIEKSIDYYNKGLETLKNFILPGGAEAAAWFHLSRTVTRRVERCFVAAFNECASHDDFSLVYINRLSDLFFVLARYSNKLQNVSDVIWDTKSRKS